MSEQPSEAPDGSQESLENAGVGPLLRASRQRVGEDLRDVAAMLRIRYSYLEAIESGRFGDLPGQTYAVGFVRAYAEHLGLDSEEEVRRFKAEIASGGGRHDLHFPTPMQETGIPGGAIVFVGLVVAVLAYGGWYLSTTEDGFLSDLIAPLPERLSALVSKDEPKEAKPDEAKPAEAAPVPEQAPPTPALESTEPAAAPAPQTAPVESTAEAEAPSATPPTPTEPAASEAQPSSPPAAEAAPSSEAAAPQAETAPAPAPAPETAAPAETAPPQTVAETPSAPETATPAAETASPQPSSEPAATTPAPAAAEVQPAAQQPEAPAANPAPAPATEQAAATPASEAETPAPADEPAGPARIKVRAKTNSYIQVRDDFSNTLLVSRVLQEGEVYEVPNKTGLSLLTGNAGALEITVDGEVVPAIGSDGAVQRGVQLVPELLKAGTAAQ
jgi:cytoskeleton protein RodZ